MPQTPRRERFQPIIRVFVSSTFSDLVPERDALQERVWPELERHCLVRGFQFQAIDLRWGVPTEAALDHRTMRICFEELRRAQEVSPRPNFLVLLGDRYGWQPLPEAIAPEEFRALQEASAGDSEYLRVLAGWYRLDANARPAVHLLRSRRESPDGRDYTKEANGRDTVAWVEVQRVLWTLINRAFPASLLAGRFAEPLEPGQPAPPIVRFQGSATEQEIWHGALSVADAPGHIVAFSREIANLETTAGHHGLGNFVNVAEAGSVDADAYRALRALKAQLRQRLGESYFEAPEPATLRPALEASDETAWEISTDHLDFLCTQVRERLLPIIEQQIDEYHRVPETAGDAPLPADVLRDLRREREHHARFAAERAPAGVFVGRQAELARILAYVEQGGDRPFVLHGVAGSGKSALMAAAVREASGRSTAIVVERYLGTTKRSSDLRALLVDLCQSLREHFPLPEEVPTDVRPLEQELYAQLEHATAERPVYLFLDALDQLDPADDAYALWWIRPTPLPRHARLVVSCLSGSGDEAGGGADDLATAGPWGALRRRGFLNASSSVAIEHLEPEDARLLWTRWLDRAGRRLSVAQQAAIDERIQHGGDACRQPLYLRILFEEAQRWPSYVSPPPLGASVPELLQSLFARLSQPEAHGPLVEPALGYLVSARYGLAESELLELLLRDPEYGPQLLAPTHQALPRQARRIPIALWSRLRYDLEPYLSERGAPGGSVLHVYHRQVEVSARECFARTSARRHQWHRRLSLYFARQPWWLEPRAKQRERMQPPYSARPANVRKITELPDHVLALAREAEAAGLDAETGQALTWIERLFQKLPFLEAKNEAGRVFELATDFSRALGALPETRPMRHIVKLLDQALRRDIHFIARHAQDYPQALFQCVWNHGWWYDGDETAAHYESGSASGLPLSMDVPNDQRLSHLLERWLEQKRRSASSFMWLRSSCPPPTDLEAAQSAVLRGHAGGVECVSVDGRFVLAGGDHRDPTIRLWDAESGEERVCLRGHEGSVQSVHLSRDATLIYSASRDGTVRVWDLATERTVLTQRAHGKSEPDYVCPVSGIAVFPDEDRIASVADDGLVLLTDLRTKAEVELRGHHGAVGCVAVSADGRWVISGGVDKTVRVWDAAAGIHRVEMRGHQAPVRCIAVSPDGLYAASGSEDRTIRIWRLWSGEPLATCSGHDDDVRSLAFLNDSAGLVSGSDDGTIRGWNIETGKEVFCFRGHSREVTSVATDAAGRIFGGSLDGTVSVWGSSPPVHQGRRVTHRQMITHVALSPDATRVASASRDGGLTLWNTSTARILQRFTGHRGELLQVLFVSETLLLTSGKDRTVRVWTDGQADSRVCVECYEDEIRGVQVLPDGQRALWWGGSVRVFDIESGRESMRLNAREGSISTVAIDPQGRHAAIGTVEGPILLFDLDTGAERACFQGHAPTRIQNPNQGAVISFRGGTSVVVPEFATTSAVVRCLSFSDDGQRLASGSSDCTARIWDVNSGNEIACLKGREEPVEAIVFSGEGLHVVTLHGTDLIWWDPLSGSQLAFGGAYDPEHQRLRSLINLTVSKDTRRLAAFALKPQEGWSGFMVTWTTHTRGEFMEGWSCLWDASTGELMERLDGQGDLDSIAEDAALYPVRTLARQRETVLQDAQKGRDLAAWPVPLNHLKALPDGRTFIGASGNELYWITLSSNPAHN